MQIDWNKESVYIRKECSQLPQDWLARQHGRRFIVLEHQYGHRDVIWKRSIVTSWHVSLIYMQDAGYILQLITTSSNC